MKSRIFIYVVIKSDFTIPWNSLIFQFYQADFQLFIRISRETKRTFQNQSNLSDSLSFGCVICNSKMEFTLMNNCSGSHRNNIYGRCNVSSMKTKSFSKISEKSLTSNTWNISNYVDKWIFHQWMVK